MLLLILITPNWNSYNYEFKNFTSAISLAIFLTVCYTTLIKLSVRKYYLPFEQPGLYLKTCSHPVFLCIFCFVVNQGYKGITTFVVPKETDGLSFGKKEDKVWDGKVC